jgi:hypothetical protein
MKCFVVALSAALALSAGAASAAQFVTNGGFESSSYVHNTQFGASFGGQGVTGWTGLGNDGSGQHLEFFYQGGTQTSQNATNQYGDPQGYFYPTFNALSPQGGNFVGLDSDIAYDGQISQTINGLTIGGTYTLSFYWAGAQLINRSGDTTDALHVTFGGDAFNTATVPVASGQFSGWMKETHTFKATSASQTLSFLAFGGPTGLPPIASVDGVSLTGAPEPATWAMMLTGFGGLGALLRRRRSAAAVTA